MYIGYSRTGSTETVLEMLSLMVSEGYSGLQLKGNQYAQWLDSPDTFSQKFDISKTMGIIVYGLDEGNLQKSIDFASHNDMQAVTWVPSWKRNQIDYASAAAILNQFGDYAKEKDTELSLHNHAGQLFENRNDLNEFCNLVKPELSGLTIDTAHLALGGVKDIPTVIRECKEYIYLFHIKDVQDNEFCPLGDGELHFDEIFQAIRDIEFDGWLVVDDESDQMTLEEALPHAAEFIRRYV